MSGLTCELCKEPLGRDTGYPYSPKKCDAKKRVHSRCHELRLCRETREEFSQVRKSKQHELERK
jgi:hypothetical protein